MTEAGEPIVTLNECDRVNNHFVRRKDVSPTVRHYRAKYGIVRHKDRGQIVSVGFFLQIQDCVPDFIAEIVIFSFFVHRYIGFHAVCRFVENRNECDSCKIVDVLDARFVYNIDAIIVVESGGKQVVMHLSVMIRCTAKNTDRCNCRQLIDVANNRIGFLKTSV